MKSMTSESKYPQQVEQLQAAVDLSKKWSALSLLSVLEASARIEADTATEEELGLARHFFPLCGYYCSTKDDEAEKEETAEGEQRKGADCEKVVALLRGDKRQHHLHAKLERVLPWAQSTEALLTLGGDDRLTMSLATSDKRNKYHCSPLPPKSKVVHMGSCTCSPIASIEQFAHIDKERERCLRDAMAAEVAALEEGEREEEDRGEDEQKRRDDAFWDDKLDAIRQRLSAVLKLNDDVQSIQQHHRIILTPSGSDAEFVPLCVALARSASLLREQVQQQRPVQRARVISFVTASGEVGSGTASAANGRHFSPLCPRGTTATPKTSLEGLEQGDVEVVEFPPRLPDASGSLRICEEEIVEQLVKRLLDEGEPEHAVAVLHLVCCSKTGLIYPSLASITALQARIGASRLLVVVDACQLRCRLDRVTKTYAQRGFVVLLTGSKFFAGPAFCGAVVLPSVACSLIETNINVVPVGLGDYLTPHEVPKEMPLLRAHLLTARMGVRRWKNPGLYLRWFSSLETIEKFASLPDDFIASISCAWVDKVRETVDMHSPWLQVVLAGQGDSSEDLHGGRNSIVSVLVQVEEASRANTPVKGECGARSMRRLSLGENKEMHRRLSEVGMAIGQPVQLGGEGGEMVVVRLALDAKTIVVLGEAMGLVVDGAGNNRSGWSQSEQPRAWMRGARALSQLDEDISALITEMSKLAKEWNHVEPLPIMAVEADTDPVLAAKMAEIDAALGWPPIPCVLDGTRSRPVGSFPGVLSFRSAQSALAQIAARNPKGQLPEALILYDESALLHGYHSLLTAFTVSSSSPTLPPPPPPLHCLAVKSCPLSHILHTALRAGLGMEAASWGEVTQALRCGCPPDRIVYDSPCKPLEEIQAALSKGVRININSWQELDKVCVALKGGSTRSAIGIRVNPLVGAGSIAALSTATANSTFGIALTAEARIKIIQTFIDMPALSALHCHVGSQGMPLGLLVEGARITTQLAEDIDAACGCKRIVDIDIGGGLSVNYAADEPVPSFDDYARALSLACPSLFERRVLTEFGKSLLSKAAIIVSTIEDVIVHHHQQREEEEEEVASVQRPSVTAVTHVGADLLLRTAYCPDKFSHRISLCDAYTYEPISSTTSTAPPPSSPNAALRLQHQHCTEALVTFAGPLCFSGDVLAKNLPLPLPIQGDLCVIHDAGANTLSLFSRHCSRLAPAVWGFACSASSDGDGHIVHIACVKEMESMNDMLRFWG